MKTISTLLAVACLLATAPLFAQTDAEREVAARLAGGALIDGKAWDKLAYLTDRIGHRLSGSEGLAKAVTWTAEEFKRDGIPKVWTEEVMVPHWVRGKEAARIVAPVEWDLALLALGGSVGTPEGGITAEVIEVDSLEQLNERKDEVKGKIVLFNKAIEAGFDAKYGYGSAVPMRVVGPSRAARHGAVGMLIRSLGTADFRLPHTGTLRYEDGLPKIPSAAIASEGAELIHRLLASGDPVKVHMELGAKTLPDALSHNVIADIPGREKPEEIVLIGGHLDSWDVGQGAHDDGAGCAIVMEVMRLIQKSGMKPRRTIRAVLFTNEENGLRGGRDYEKRHGHETHVAAIESDSGGAEPVGFGVSAGEGGVAMIEEIASMLEFIDAHRVASRGGGADISPLRVHGVPLMNLRQQSFNYFDYHHTEADTLDKINRQNLNKNVAALAVMTWLLAEREETLPRNEPQEGD
ncbi:hypothetical protein ABI59_06675 [Acidobacteria bacterium Mor1]|nr:hypothetical protein ABI59_06675 [Acidobacteria bacterium Mor1]